MPERPSVYRMPSAGSHSKSTTYLSRSPSVSNVTKRYTASTSPTKAMARVYQWMRLCLSAGKNTMTSAPKKGTAISAEEERPLHAAHSAHHHATATARKPSTMPSA